MEWEVYGTPAILTSTNAVTVPEGTNATFQVRLNYIPPSPTTVTVSRVSGDTNITVLSGDSLVFNTNNWNINQTVTLGAAKDPDWTNGSAVIRCSAPGIVGNDVTATEDDNTAAGNPDQRECGHGAGRRHGELPGQAQHGSAQSHDGDRQPGERGSEYQCAVGRVAGVQRLQLEQPTRR